MENFEEHFSTAVADESSLLQRLASYTASLPTPDALNHGIHPYPAKFIPQIPREIIAAHTNERNTVFDPFCGSGTTLLEACMRGRKSVGCDSNPIATLVAKAKCTALSEGELDKLSAFVDQTLSLRIDRRATSAVPKVPGLDHWFPRPVSEELATLRLAILKECSENVRAVLLCLLSSIIVAVSNQESETRYAAIEKQLGSGDVFRRFFQKAQRMLPSLKSFSEQFYGRFHSPRIFTNDVRLLSHSSLATSSVDLVVTSPPYANSFDYYLYHKWRMVWLGYNYDQVRQQEIGSRHEHSSKKAPIDTFRQKMLPAMETISRALKPSKLAYVLIGDSVIGGRHIDMSEIFVQLGTGCGLKNIDCIDYDLSKISRSFREKSANSHGGAKHKDKRQHILVFERTGKPNESSIGRAKASPKSSWDLTKLEGKISHGAQIAISSSDRDRHIHAMGMYPSKFFPEIPRWAITEYSEPGATVYDPFLGSGTTAIEATTLRRNAVGCDISAYACLLARAKTTRVTEKTLRREASKLLKIASSGSRLPKVKLDRFDLDEFWFPLRSLLEIAQLRAAILQEISPWARDFFLACLALVIRKSSYQDEAQLKVKRDPKKVLLGTSNPTDLFIKLLPRQLDRLVKYNELISPDATSEVFNGDARQVSERLNRKVDLVVTSPPYINAMNYPMVHRYENILLGLLRPEDKIRHEQEYIGSERVHSAEYSRLRTSPREWPFAKELDDKLQQIYCLEPKRSFVVYHYFAEMAETFSKLVPSLNQDGRMVLVAGRNRIKGVRVPTFEYLCALATISGLKLETSFDYEIVKHAFKLTRHETADLIKVDGVGVFKRP